MKTITLTMNEEKKLFVLEKVFRSELTMVEAAQVLDLSERHLYRVKASVKSKGPEGVVHGNRGKPCPWRLSLHLREEIPLLATGKYRGFNDTHFTEKLEEVEKIGVSRETVRKLLRCKNIASPRKKRPPKHRSRRPRKEAAGMMVQTDGSEHDWLEGRGPVLHLLGVIDDATSEVPNAFFEDEETTEGYFRLFHAMAEKKGLPLAIYADKYSTFWLNKSKLTLENQLLNRIPLTQVGRALKELTVTLIPAGSPQAKGRVERLWGTFQDRLTSELRLAKAGNKEQAQKVLEGFLPQYNRRFTKPPQQTTPAWRKIPASVDLLRTFCWKYQRCVANDYTVAFCNRALQIPKLKAPLSLPGKTVDVLVLLDGTIEIFYQKHKLARFKSTIINLEQQRKVA